jgi:hypothetical protein
MEQTRSLYPLLDGIEERHPKPVSVHLQVYDGTLITELAILKPEPEIDFLGTCHVLPVLFLFCTPAKYCYRAMATFIKFVTGMPFGPSVSASDSSILPMGRHASSPEMKRANSPDQIDPTGGTREDDRLSSAGAPKSEQTSGSNTPTGASMSRKQSLRRAFSYKVAIAGRALRRQSREPIKEDSLADSEMSDGDINGSISRGNSVGQTTVSQDRCAGESSVYEDIQVHFHFLLVLYSNSR